MNVTPATYSWVLLLVALVSSLPGLANGQTYEDPSRIRSTAQEFLAQQAAGFSKKPSIEIGNLDPRLQLTHCDKELEAFLPAGGRTIGNTTVGIRCPGTKPWLVYLPVSIRAPGKVLVAALPLARDSLLKAEHVQLVERDLANLPMGYVSDLGQVLGKRLKQPLGTGSAISPNMLEAPQLVRRGGLVTILAAANGLEVRVQGEALNDGAAGDWIRVRNVLTRKVIEGVVTPTGLIQVQM